MTWRALAAAWAAAALAVGGPASAQPSADGPTALSDPAALQPFFKALSALQTGRRSTPVQILQIGDSHTAADHIASVVRTRLQARFGEGGRGVIPPGIPFKAYAPRQIAVSQWPGWRLERSFPLAAATGPFGLSGWRLTSVRTGASLTVDAQLDATFDQAIICAMAAPEAGALTVKAGERQARIRLSARRRQPVCRTVRFEDRQSRVELKAIGPVTLLSLSLERAEGGVSLSNLGIIGSQLYDFAARDDAILRAELAVYRPDLIILAFGTNEGFRRAFDAAGYQQLVREQIRRLKALAPRAAILLLGPPDAETVRPDIPEDGVHNLNFACAPLTADEASRYPALVAAKDPALARWYAPPALAQARAAQRHAAASEGAAFWDWQARLGGDCVAHRFSRPGVGLVRGDHVHFTTDGGALVAAMLTQDLMAAYDQRGERLMLFPTMMFGLFFLFVFAVAWSLDRENGRRKAFLVLASWVFYGWWDWRFVGLLIFNGVFNWAVVEAIDRSNRRGARRALVAAAVVVNLSILGFFKYYGFFIDQLGVALDMLGWKRDLPLLQVVLPIGISFFTFQAISYVVDVYRGRCDKARSLLDVMLMVSFFPHLISGPIVRARDLLPQFAQVPRPSRAMISQGLLLIVWGLFKKTVIASELSTGLVDPVFFDPASHGAADLWAAAYGYAVQIYCDFSAYSDIAIGVAALLGYRFPRNFDQPYRAASLQDFWRRWHISLSSWLRDYLYIPLGGGRGGLVKTCRNIMITMVLGGLWHGAAWTFVAWGALHGAVLCAERVLSARRARQWPAVVGVLVTFHIVCLGWILFRSESFAMAVEYLQGLGRWSQPATAATPFLVELTAIGLALHFLPPRAIERLGGLAKYAPSPALGAAIGALMLVIEAVRPAGVAPFIYFQF